MGDRCQKFVIMQPNGIPTASPYCNMQHDGSTNPCKGDKSDFCCDYECTHCGPATYCSLYSPFKSHSGYCNPDYVGGVCPNYYALCEDFEVGDVVTVLRTLYQD